MGLLKQLEEISVKVHFIIKDGKIHINLLESIVHRLN